jgi:YgiT-type zinc finger domain-containing protein
MKCVVCKLGESREGLTTVTRERDGAALVVRKVPAQVCHNCGEAYVTAEVTRRLLQSAREALRAGVEALRARLAEANRPNVLSMPLDNV